MHECLKVESPKAKKVDIFRKWDIYKVFKIDIFDFEYLYILYKTYFNLISSDVYYLHNLHKKPQLMKIEYRGEKIRIKFINKVKNMTLNNISIRFTLYQGYHNPSKK